MSLVVPGEKVTDLKAIRQKILEFIPAENLTSGNAAQMTANMDENVRLPFRRICRIPHGPNATPVTERNSIIAKREECQEQRPDSAALKIRK